MMETAEYDRRLVELFKSGKATPAQWAELVEAVGCAFDKDARKLKAINDSIGFTAAQKVWWDEEDARSLNTTHRKADQAADRRWAATRRRLKINGCGRSVARRKRARA